MSLVTTNSNGRENVYANVGADGNPVNVQSNRYVEVGDSITVWGVLGNSYLIEYPTSSGTHKGFIKNTKTSKPTYNPSPSVDLSGLCSEEIINAVDAFFDVHKWSEEDEANNKYVGVGVLSPEYALARDILMNETPDNNWFAAFLTYLGKDQFDNVWSFVQGNEALEKEEIKAAIYLVLENVIYDDVDNFEMAEAAETIDDIASQVGGIKDTIKRGKQAYELTTEIIYQTNPELANKFTQLYLDIMNTDKYPTNAPISKLILDLQNQKALDATIKYSVLALKIIADTMEIAYIRNRTSVETIALLKEAFGNISTGTADDLRYKQMLLDVLEEIELELNSNIWSTAVSIMDVLGDHIAKNTIKNIAKETLKAVGKTAVFSAVTVYDLLRSAVLSFSGLDDYINACNESYALLPIGGVIDSLYLDYVIKYKQQGFTEEEYFKFYCLHILNRAYKYHIMK